MGSHLTKAFFVGVAAFFLVGCATSPGVDTPWTPTLTLSCASGCEATFTDPRDRPTRPTNGWDATNTVVRTVGQVLMTTAPWVAIGAVAVEGVRSAGNTDQSVRAEYRSDSRDQSTRIDATHTPTVITQPLPVVVEQPAPVVVQPRVYGFD